MVKFYAPYCGYCKKMIPAYDKLAENMKGIVDIAAIDCTSSFNQAICSKYHVEGMQASREFLFLFYVCTRLSYIEVLCCQ